MSASQSVLAIECALDAVWKLRKSTESESLPERLDHIASRLKDAAYVLRTDPTEAAEILAGVVSEIAGMVR